MSYLLMLRDEATLASAERELNSLVHHYLPGEPLGIWFDPEAVSSPPAVVPGTDLRIVESAGLPGLWLILRLAAEDGEQSGSKLLRTLGKLNAKASRFQPLEPHTGPGSDPVQAAAGVGLQQRRAACGASLTSRLRQNPQK